MVFPRKWLGLLLSVLFCCESTPVTKADLILQFSPDNSVTGVAVDVGQSFAIDVYIAQSGAFTGLSDNGLIGFGFRGTFSEVLLKATGGVTDTAFNFSGDPNADISSPGQIDMFGGSSNPPKSGVIHLGTLNFTALAAGMTAIALGDLDPSFDDFSLNDVPAFTALDSTLFGPGLNQTYVLNVTVAAVPEPSTSLSLIAACSLFLCLGWFRRKLAWLSGQVEGAPDVSKTFTVDDSLLAKRVDAFHSVTFGQVRVSI